MTRLTDIIAIAIFITPNAIVGAQAPALTLAPRVRVTAPGALLPARQSGRVLAVSRDSLKVQLDGRADSLWLARATFTALEVSRGLHRSMGKGILLGMLSGATVGAVIGAATYRPPAPCANGSLCSSFTNFDRLANATAGSGVGLAVGAIVGGFVGHQHQREAWERVPPGPLASLLRTGPNHLHVTSGDRVAALSLAFQF